MARKKKRPAAQQPAPLSWTFDPSIPTEDFFEGMPLTDLGHLQEAVENFIYWLEGDRFLTWEAVMCQEQGLPLTAQQAKAVSGLINFGDPEDDQIHYIDEIPRTNEPWYTILNRLVPHLPIEPFRTFEGHEEVKCQGWPRIMTALQEHGQGLSLPAGVTSFREVVPADLRHKLWLQYCFEILGGLGQTEDLNLEEDTWRMDEFIDRLRECKESVAHFNLTLESLLTRVILPEQDRPIFIQLMQDRLNLRSLQEPIADHLS